MTVAALYIDPGGPYPKIKGVECYGLPERDARTYEGPYPVVAHPPCGRWGRLRHLARTTDADCAPRAVEQVRAWGGVLEHPAGSKLWRALELPEPMCLPDAWGGYCVEVSQCDWGHVARKMTWLYLVRVPRSALRWPTPREPTHWISGGRGRAGKKAKTTPVPPGIKVCSVRQRRRTPIDFARYLVELAELSSASC